MGSDVYCKVNDNGKATVEHNRYQDFRSTLKGVLKILHYMPPGRNNLVLFEADQKSEGVKHIGDPNLTYGWHVGLEGEQRIFGPNHSTTIIGEDVYILASVYPPEKGKLDQIYKVGLSTNETTRITDFPVSDFKIINNKLYYVKAGGKGLYTSNLDGTGEKKLSDDSNGNTIGWFGEIEGNVYYATIKGEEKLQLYKADPSNTDSLLLKETIETVQIVDEKIICKLTTGQDYGIKVFDKTGKLHLAVADQVSRFFAYKDKILMVSSKDKSIKVIQ